MAQLLTLGELLVDLTQTGYDKQQIRLFSALPGGAPANVAVAAVRLGTSSGFIGKVGADVFGRDLRSVLERSGVETQALFETTQALTTVAVVSVSPAGERSFAFYRSPGADTLLTVEEAISALCPLPRILHIGSLSLTADPARQATLAALQAAREAGVIISYDPNYRAALWPDEATAIAWMNKPLTAVDILKLSAEELPLLTGTNDPERGTSLLAEHGIKLILLTLGAEGCYYRFGAETGRVPGFSVPVADTNGAGDTFLGAILSRLLRRNGNPFSELTGSSLESMIRFANCAAALTCTRHGAIPAMPTAAEVEAFLSQ